MGSPEREFELTQREGEIARLIAEGKTNKRIAAELHIAVATVKNHVHRVLKKMGATRRSEVAVRWTRRTIREPPSLRSRRAVGPQPHSI
jgi:DNA-binding NarL/FixJ family response regulator